jgi:hypothetical protein
MNKKLVSLMVLGVALLLAAPVHAGIAVQMEGTATANAFSALSSDQQQVIADFFANPSTAKGRVLEDFLCYVLPLADLESGATIGTGADCLRIFGVEEDGTPGVTDPAISPMIDAVTFFFLPGGHFTADGMTTVRPFYAGVGDAGGEVTHLTGSIPASSGPSGIVGGSGEFAGAAGKVRLSGAVNLSNFFSDGNPIFFSCLFVAEMKSPLTAEGRVNLSGQRSLGSR